jgi:glycosyltransferase involved in cell wall biosynthesis
MTARARRPRVALVAHSALAHGGNDRTLFELIERAHDRIDFVVISSKLAPELRARVEWKRVPVPPRPAPLRFVSFLGLAGLRLSRTRADLVHTQGGIVPNRSTVASVHHCHAGFARATGGLAPSAGPLLRRVNHALSRSLAIAAERWCYRPARVRVLAGPSPGATRELAELYPTVAAELVPNGVDVVRFAPDPEARTRVRGAEGVGDDDVVVLFVGGDWDHKGLAVVIEGVALAGGRTGRPVRLWVVGDGDRPRFEATAERLGVRARVRFFGHRDDVERFHHGADVFVLPSLYESFSLAAFEAAASGLPGVATRLHGIGDLLADGGAGVTVERTGSSVAAALSALAEDEALRQSLGAEARRRACRYTWDDSVEAVLDLYRRYGLTVSGEGVTA